MPSRHGVGHGAPAHQDGRRTYVIRRITIPTIGRWRRPRVKAMIRSRHQPSNEEVPNGPARDPDRDTGSAARPRSRRAPARWVQATTANSPSLPLIAIGRSAVAHIEYRPTSSGSPPPGPMAPPRSGADLPPAPLRRVRPEPSRSAPAKRLAARYVKGHSENRRKTDASAIRSDVRFGKRARIPGLPWKRSKQRDGHPAARPPSGDRPTCPSRLPRRRLSLQGRSDRLAPTRCVLRILGSEPRRDSRPSRRAGSGLALRPGHGTPGLNSSV